MGLGRIIALVFVVFFVWGLADGSVSEFNILLWLAVLAALGGVLGGSSWLRSAGQQRIANVILLSLRDPRLPRRPLLPGRDHRATEVELKGLGIRD